MTNEQLEDMLHVLSTDPALLYKIERIDLADGESCSYGVMNYKDQVYEVYTAQLHHQALTCMGDEDDPFPSIAYKAQYTTNTDDTLHVYTRVEHRGSGHGCKLLEAAIKHCIEKNWRVSVSTDIPKIQAVLDESGLNKDCSGYWQRKSNK